MAFHPRIIVDGIEISFSQVRGNANASHIPAGVVLGQPAQGAANYRPRRAAEQHAFRGQEAADPDGVQFRDVHYIIKDVPIQERRGDSGTQPRNKTR
jgi:hypothetical protein